jgi:cell division protein FtsA
MARRQSINVALDIGTHKTSVLVAATGDEHQAPQIIGLGTAPSLGLKRGVVVNIDSTVQSIQHAVREAEVMADCEIHSVVVSVSGNHVRGFNSHGMVPIRTREVTLNDVELVLDAARAVALPMDRDVLHVLPQEYIVDDQDGIREPQGMAGVRLESKVHVLTGSTAAVQNVIKCCNRAGLAVSQIVLAPLASAEAVLTHEERDLGVGVVDIGGGTTDLIVYHGGSVRHTAVLGLGGNQLTNDIATGLRTPPAEAEKVKQRYGCAMASSVGADERVEVPSVGGRGPRILSRQILAEIIEPRVEEILALVSREVVRAGVESMIASGVVLTGGTASLEGIVQLAERVFQTPVRIGGSQQAGGLGDIVGGPAYATGVGLLLLAGRAEAGAGINGNGSVGVLSRVKHRMTDWLRDFF